MRVEILTAPDNGFVVGRDLVGYARVGSDPDVWSDLLPGSGELSAIRGGTTGRVNTLDVGTLTVPLKDADPTTDLRLRVGRHLRLYDEDRDEVLWYGRVADIPATDEGTYSVTTLVATDAVDSLANASRYGAGVYGVTETLAGRVTRLATTATVPLHYDRPGVAFESVATVPGGISEPVTVPYVTGWTYRASVDFVATGAALEPHDLAGNLYLFGHDGITETEIPLYGAAGRAAFQWTARTNGEVYLTLEAQPGVTVTANTLAVVRQSGPAVLQAVAYEGPVSEHLNMACDSVGAVWRPTLAGDAEIFESVTLGAPVASFSDDRAVSPADASYTRLAFGYATGDDLVNDLTVTNHGRTLEGDAADTTFTVTNPASVAGHGRRSASLDTCLALEADTLERARAVLDGLATPAWGPRSLTYRYADLAHTPDLYDLVTVWRRGTAHTCLVLGIAHQVRPDPERPHAPIAHLVTLTLGKATP